MTENYFTLWDANMGTVAVLNGRTMQVDSDGTFTITVDADPANGRRNHVQTTPEAHEFYIRDVLLELGPRRPQSPFGAASRCPRTMHRRGHSTSRPTPRRR